jgi:hypothetical protein
VSTDAPEAPGIEVALKLAVTPEVLVLRPTVTENPVMLVTVIVDVLEPPCATVRLVGLAAMPKSGGDTIKVTVAV